MEHVSPATASTMHLLPSSFAGARSLMVSTAACTFTHTHTTAPISLRGKCTLKDSPVNGSGAHDARRLGITFSVPKRIII
eukprot:1177831-Prorocentrum_minimum.AAC.2